MRRAASWQQDAAAAAAHVRFRVTNANHGKAPAAHAPVRLVTGIITPRARGCG